MILVIWTNLQNFQFAKCSPLKDTYKADYEQYCEILTSIFSLYSMQDYVCHAKGRPSQFSIKLFVNHLSDHLLNLDLNL